jgi:prepilin-type N-terminal cleavage/methylation domain-containing protein
MRRGFTLVELMVLIVIAGLILGVGLPAWLDYRQSTDRRQAPDQVRTDIETARRLATERHMPVILAFGRPPSTLYLMHFDSNGNGRVDPGEGARICELPAGTQFTRITFAPSDTLWFEPDGMLKSGSRGGFVVIRGQRFTDTLFVSDTGQVEVP